MIHDVGRLRHRDARPSVDEDGDAPSAAETLDVVALAVRRNDEPGSVLDAVVVHHPDDALAVRATDVPVEDYVVRCDLGGSVVHEGGVARERISPWAAEPPLLHGIAPTTSQRL